MIDLAAAINESRQMVKVHPTYIPRASEIGHPCEEYLRLSITSWEKKELPSPILGSIFHQGNVAENDAVQTLLKLGFKVTEQNRDGIIKGRDGKDLISWHVDWLITDNATGERVAVEHKRLSPYVWPELNTVDDFLNSDRVHIRKYPAQLQVYLVGREVEMGILLLMDAWKGVYKQVTMALNYEYAESLLQKAERVKAAVSEGHSLKKVNDPAICLECPFRHVCLPDIKGVALAVGDSDFEQLVARRQELKTYLSSCEDYKTAEKEKDKVEARIKEYVAASGGKVMTSRYYAELKTINRKAMAASSYEKLTIKELMDPQ